MIIACLAVTTILTACDKDKDGDDGTTSGNVDKNIIDNI